MKRPYPGSKLTAEQVYEIRRRYKRSSRQQDSTTALAQEFGVSRSAVERVLTNKAWRREITNKDGLPAGIPLTLS
jgi:DNA invertase Pin-like site-specific DNA recombinase